jgi:hypothetical protein
MSTCSITLIVWSEASQNREDFDKRQVSLIISSKPKEARRFLKVLQKNV